MYVWGNSEFGIHLTPFQVQSSWLVDIGVGLNFGVCLDLEGKTWVYGDGSKGQLGGESSSGLQLLSGLQEKKVLKISIGGGHIIALGENKNSLDISIPSKLMKNETEENIIASTKSKLKRKRRLSVGPKPNDENMKPSFRQP